MLGIGTDVIYPPENDELAEQILMDGGAILSEYIPGTRPNAGHFPARNRIISGMTLGFALGVALSVTGLKLCGVLGALLLVTALIFGIVSKNKKEVAAA